MENSIHKIKWTNQSYIYVNIINIYYWIKSSIFCGYTYMHCKYDDMYMNENLYSVHTSTGHMWCYTYRCSLVAKSWSTLGEPIDCRPPGSPVHAILQARILEWISISFSRRSSWSRDWTHVSCTGRQILYHIPSICTHLLSKLEGVL